jgi:hypothetical protein
LPRSQWRDLIGKIFIEQSFYYFYHIIERLVANVTTVGRPDNVREASLEALGYICQDIVNKILFFHENKTKSSL